MAHGRKKYIEIDSEVFDIDQVAAKFNYTRSGLHAALRRFRNDIPKVLAYCQMRLERIQAPCLGCGAKTLNMYCDESCAREAYRKLKGVPKKVNKVVEELSYSGKSYTRPEVCKSCAIYMTDKCRQIDLTEAKPKHRPTETCQVPIKPIGDYSDNRRLASTNMARSLKC